MSLTFPVFFIHGNNKVEKLRANIDSEPVTSTKTLATGQPMKRFLNLKASQSTVNECNLSLAPKSCNLDPIRSNLLIECLDSIQPSPTDTNNSSHESSIFSKCIKSVHVTSKDVT